MIILDIVNDLVFSMLSYSKRYQPYVYSWGKRVGRTLVREKIQLDTQTMIKSGNIFEYGLVAGVMEQLSSKKIISPKTRYSLEYYRSMRNKNIKAMSQSSLLKVAYPYLYLSPGSHTLLYWIGKESGTKFGKKYKHKLNHLKNISEKLDVGHLKIKDNKIILYNSVFAKNAGETGNNICSYYAGFIAGFLSSSKKRCNVVERKCISCGDKYCEFIILFSP